MQLNADQLLQRANGKLSTPEVEEPRELEVKVKGGESRLYQLQPPSLPKLQEAAQELEGFRSSSNPAQDFERILHAFMDPQEATRFVKGESLGTVIRVVRGLVAGHLEEVKRASESGG